jgi:hypothetical protein
MRGIALRTTAARLRVLVDFKVDWLIADADYLTGANDAESLESSRNNGAKSSI